MVMRGGPTAPLIRNQFTVISSLCCSSPKYTPTTPPRAVSVMPGRKKYRKYAYTQRMLKPRKYSKYAYTQRMLKPRKI